MADYSNFKIFIDKFISTRFEHISRLDPFMIDLEEKLRNDNQFFYIADLLAVKVLFTSSGSEKLIGINPDEVDAYTFFMNAHPEDQERLNHAQSKLFKQGQSLLIDHKDGSYVSTQVRQCNSEGHYKDFLLQTYSFYSEIPAKAVYTMIVATDLDSSLLGSQYYHYYAGYDASTFRYPDKALLQKGHKFSQREFEIIKLIAAGESSENIADTLQISINTVNTHRRNILKKTKKSTTHELIVEMQENGIL